MKKNLKTNTINNLKLVELSDSTLEKISGGAIDLTPISEKQCKKYPYADASPSTAPTIQGTGNILSQI